MLCGWKTIYFWAKTKNKSIKFSSLLCACWWPILEYILLFLRKWLWIIFTLNSYFSHKVWAKTNYKSIWFSPLSWADDDFCRGIFCFSLWKICEFFTLITDQYLKLLSKNSKNSVNNFTFHSHSTYKIRAKICRKYRWDMLLSRAY